MILRHLIAFDRHKSSNLTCRRSLPYSTDRIRRLIEATAGGPFGDDARRKRVLRRARIEARSAGLVRIYADHKNGVLTGATLFAPGMDHIAHLFAWAIERGETAAALLALPFYHPTLEEGLKPALRQICQAVHAPELEHLDDVAPPGA